MATKLYPHDASASPSDWQTGNNDTNLRGSAFLWNDGVLDTTPGSSAIFVSTATVAGPTAGVEVGSTTTARAWISPPLDAAVTISGSITWNLWAAESSNSANVAINGRIEKIDGATGAITLIDATARTTEVALTTRAVNNFAETPAAGVACNRGDRLRVRIYGDDSTSSMATAFTFTFGYDGPTAAADGDSWVQLTENLTFVSEPAGTQVFPTDTASVFIAATPAALLSSFTGADEDPLSEGGNWAAISSAASPNGALKRVSNQAAANSGINAYSYWTPTNFGPDVEAYVTLATVSGSMAVLARVQQEGGNATWDGYEVSYNGGGTTIVLLSVTNGGTTLLGSLTIPAALANGSKLGIACHGDSIQAWYQPLGGAWAMAGARTDTTYPSAGKVGLFTANVSARFDDFYAGTTTGGSFVIGREAWTSRGAGVATDVTNTVAGWTAPIQVTDTAGGTVVDWFTRPLTAFTLGGAVRVNARTQRTTGSASNTVRCEVAVVAGDGTSPTVWGATTGIVNGGASETAKRFLVGGTDVAVTAGQRLRIRFYLDDAQDAAMASGSQITLYYAGAASATGDTYLTFTQTLTEFISAPTYQPRNAAINHQNPGVL